MGTIISRNGSLKLGASLEDINITTVGYIYSSVSNKKEKAVTNVQEDIIIRDKDFIIMKVPFQIKEKKKIIDIVMDGELCVINYEEEKLIDFIKEKIIHFKKVDKFIITLLVFEYLSFSYTEELLGYEEELDKLYEKAINKGIIDNKKVLSLKKSIALMKRFNTYYISILTYMDNEFKATKLYNKTVFALETTANLIINVESEVYSCIDIYNSVLSNKMNKTMQLLTVITVSFMPLTIITGIFGMNFSNMPLIRDNNGFYLTLGLTLIFVIIELVYFKFKRFM